MKARSRPVAVTVVAIVYIIAGTVGILYHLPEVRLVRGNVWEPIAGLLIRALAILAGVYLLTGKNWARWLAIIWMAFHVVVSIFHPIDQLIMHAVFLVLIAYLLLRPAADTFFRPEATGTGAL